MQALLAANRGFVPSLYNGICDGSGCHYKNIDQLYIILANVIQILLAVIGALAVIFIIYGAIQYIISEGEPSKVTSAKSTITNAIAGLILSGGAYLIVDFLARQF